MRNSKKKYTESQLSIINQLYAEFDKQNEAINLIDSNVIKAMYLKAKDSADEEKKFYREIEQNNNRLLSIKEELIVSFDKKLRLLFKDYKYIQIKSQTNGYINVNIIKEYKDLPQQKNVPCVENMFSIMFGVVLKKNHTTQSNYTTTFRFNDDKNKRGVSVYERISPNINNQELNLEDFEHSEIFKEKVFDMFNQAMTKYNIR